MSDDWDDLKTVETPYVSVQDEWERRRGTQPIGPDRPTLRMRRPRTSDGVPQHVEPEKVEEVSS